MSSPLNIKKLDASAPSFAEELGALIKVSAENNLEVEGVVAGIIGDVASRGDAALVDYTRKFDGRDIASPSDLIVADKDIRESLALISADEKAALQTAFDRIQTFHEQQKQASFSYTDAGGHVLGQKVNPLQKVGVYVPGGKAAYPSTVLMNCIPALVAGVEQIIMTVPTPSGELNPLVLAAAQLCGVKKVITIGGAQAVAALAYGTELIEPVDKIVGPGNIYVATAKKQVFGKVGIDIIAGPTEILILCDGKTNPDWIAADLFSQAEHDENAQAILISDDETFLAAVEASMNKLLPKMQRKGIIIKSIEDRGALIKVDSLQAAIPMINRIAPEHLELSFDEPEIIADQIINAGAIFLGRYTAEAHGDYCAGNNHVLPTSGCARFSSPLGVYDFVKRTSLVNLNQATVATLSKAASVLAHAEGLQAHALSAELRAVESGSTAELGDDGETLE